MSTDTPAKPTFNWSYLSTMEPAVLRGIWVAIVGVLSAFGLAVSDATSAKAASIIGAATIIVPLVQAFWTRQAVSPVAKLQQLEEAVTAAAPAIAPIITSTPGPTTTTGAGATATVTTSEPSPMPMATGGGYEEPAPEPEPEADPKAP